MIRFCSIDGCEKKHYGKGFCSKHYQRDWSGLPIEFEKEIMRRNLPKNHIPLTRGKYAIVDEDMAEEIGKYNWHCTYYGYAKRLLSKKPLIHQSMHELVMGCKNIDHINHDTLDNRRANLRVCTSSQNLMNTRKRRNTSSKYKGVSLENGKWSSYITKDKKRHRLGRFIKEEEAALYYNIAAQLFFGEFAFLNPIKNV